MAPGLLTTTFLTLIHLMSSAWQQWADSQYNRLAERRQPVNLFF